MTWLAGSFLVLGIALMAGFAWYERSHPTSHVLALIATLAALAAVGRIAFAPIPSVKPTTDLVLITGYVLGGAPGFVVGAIAALTSNLFFGQGPWTPWQMLAWGSVGLSGALLAALAGHRVGRWSLTAACFAAGLLYGAIMNFSLWVTYSGDHTLAKLGSYFATSLTFDLAHAAGNAVFCLAFGPALVAALRRYRTRFEVVWKPVAAAAGAVLVLALPSVAAAEVPRQAVDYLRKAQNDDGGFGPAPGTTSTQLHSGWAALGLAAVGRNPIDEGVVAYMRSRASDLNDQGELMRTILVLAASGADPRDFAGRNLLREAVGKQRRDGSFAGRVNTTSFAVLALRAAGRSPDNRLVRDAARWIARQSNEDGGFNFAVKGGASGIDDTGAALQALVAAGRRKTPTVERAARFLARRQNRDGGFPLQPGGGSNAQSTSWAIQGLIAAGRDIERVRRNGARTPTAYLRTLVGPDGSVRYSRTGRQTPVWVTAQAIMALAGKPLPLAPVPRAKPAAAPTPRPTPRPRKTLNHPTKRARPLSEPSHSLGEAAAAGFARELGVVVAILL